MATSNEEMATKMEVAKSGGVVDTLKGGNDPVTYVMLTNRRGRTIKLEATKSWTGDFFDKPAGSIDAGQESVFSQRGSKGAVIYGEEDATNPAAYLVAWSITDDVFHPDMKVLVECGPLSQVYYSGWENAALNKINDASDESSAKNDRTSSSANANISDKSGTFIMGVARVSVA